MEENYKVPWSKSFKDNLDPLENLIDFAGVGLTAMMLNCIGSSQEYDPRYIAWGAGLFMGGFMSAYSIINEKNEMSNEDEGRAKRMYNRSLASVCISAFLVTTSQEDQTIINTVYDVFTATLRFYGGNMLGYLPGYIFDKIMSNESQPPQNKSENNKKRKLPYPIPESIKHRMS